MHKLLIAFGLVSVGLSAFADLTLDGAELIVSSRTISDKVTGSGYFVVANGATLTLSNSMNDFTGGVIISNGVLEATASRAFGTGPIIEAGSAENRMVKLNAKGGVFPNALIVRDRGNASAAYPAIHVVKSVSSWSGDISLDQGVADVASAYLRLKVGLSASDNELSATFEGSCDAGLGRIEYRGWGQYYMKGRVKAANAYHGGDGASSETGCVTYYNPENEIGYVGLCAFDIGCANANVLRNAGLEFRWAESWYANGHGFVKLNGYDQAFKYITSKYEPKKVGAEDYALGFETPASKPCAITVNGHDGKTVSGSACVRTGGPISLIVEKAPPFEDGWTLCQAIRRRKCSLTDIAVRSGVLEVNGGATFPSLTSIEVSGGRFGMVGENNAFSAVRTISHTGGDLFCESDGPVTPINSPNARYFLSSGATITFAAGVTNVVGSLYVNGVLQPAGVYTKAQLPTIMAESADTGALLVLGISCELQNGGFEDLENGKARGWYAMSGFSALRGEGQDGSVGMVFSDVAARAAQTSVMQSLGALEPGATYRFAAWVNTEVLPGSSSGVFLCLAWYDGDGKYIGETRSDEISTTTGGWKMLELISKRLPDNAASGQVGLYVPGSFVGRVAFDNAEFGRYVRAPVVAVHLDAYRGEVSAGDVTFAAALTPEAFGADANDVRAVFTFTAPGGATVVREGDLPSPDVARITLSADLFAPGTNEVACALWCGDRLIGEARTSFVRTATPTERKVAIDRCGRTIVDGRPFFPLGMYVGRNMTAADLARYRESKFNCVMQYGSPDQDQMTAYGRAGLKVIYDVASQYGNEDAGTNYVRRTIEKFKDNPAVLAWYMFDEQPVPNIPLLADRYRFIGALDPDHPVWGVQDIPEEIRHYVGAADLIGCDPYPVAKRPVSQATDYLRETKKGLMGVRPVWEVVQCFGWHWHDRSQADQRRPTEAEVRNMAWQALAGGARGLVFYSYSYLCSGLPEREDGVEQIWAEWKRVAAEIDANGDLLLAPETETLSGLPEGWVGRTWRDGDRYLTAYVHLEAPYEVELEHTGGARFVSTSQTVTRKLSGWFHYVVTDGATLTLTNPENDFTGGVIISNGVLEATASLAFGTGPIVEAGTADSRVVRLNATDGTFPNALIVKDAGNSSRDSPAIHVVKSVKSWSGDISLDPSLPNVSSAYLILTVGASASDSGLYANFDGACDAGAGQLSFRGWGRFNMRGKVKAGTARHGDGGSWTERGCVTYYRPENEIGAVNLYAFDIGCANTNVLRDCTFNFNYYWESTGHCFLKLDGFDQTFKYLNGTLPSAMRPSDYSLGIETPAAKPCTVTVNANGGREFYATAEIRIDGPVSLVVEKSPPFEDGWAFYQRVNKRKCSITNITVRSGVFETRNGATFPSLTSIDVSGGRFNMASVPNAITALRILRHTGGELRCEGGQSAAINSPEAEYRLSGGATINFYAGVTNVVGTFYIGGVQQRAGVYTREKLPSIMSKSADTGALQVLNGPGMVFLVR